MTNTNVKDWHTILGHPSDSYLKHLFKEGKIKGKFKPSKDCQICQKAKIQNRPHNRALPSSTTVFHWLHTDTLEITPATEQGIKYVLVIVDGYAFVNELHNKVNVTPAFLHTDRGGEFDLTSFQQFLFNKVISLKQGPADSPQTNGVSERFNQTLLTKIFCLLAQSKIPIWLWNEAANHSSLLLNLLPHKAIGMNSPYEVLYLKNMILEAPIKLERLMPFGLKTTVHVQKMLSKLALRGETLRALTFEKYSDIDRTIRQDVVSLPLPVVRDHLPSIPAISSVDNIECSNQQDTGNTNETTQSNVKRSRRKGNVPDRVLLADLVTYSKAMNYPIKSKRWKEAMDLEFELLTSHNTGELVPYPKDGKVIGGMWRSTKKCNEYGEVYRYKARWVVFGNHQEHLLHYFDTWASVGRNESFKVMVSLVVNSNYIPYQFDIETAFLHGEMDTTFTLTKCGMTKAKSDDSLYLNHDKSLILHMHIDDGFLIGKEDSTIKAFVSALSKDFSLKSKVKPTQHLGYKLEWYHDGSVGLSQPDLIKKLIHDNDMDESRSLKTLCNGNLMTEIEDKGEVVAITPYQQAIGSLNYLAQHTRPDIMFTVNQLSRYSTKPTSRHWTALKHLLRYLKGTMLLVLVFSKAKDKNETPLAGWADADYANDKIDRKSIPGYVITFLGNPICWWSKKQLVVTQSTTEVEFIVMNVCVKQLLWTSYLLTDIGLDMVKPVLYNDNSGATTISKQASLNANTKHIEVQFQYVRDLVMKRQLNLVQVGSGDMIADVLTKPLGLQKLTEVYQQLHLKGIRGVL
ncbi:hypothetical protein O181_074722 [Austropuccinia psidii MF-1]|uniref:Integrase catalytic domain-containing protein n=1 Tax=Austropuccinia psidii MF-1 TaxID=1389203 RepID=A0A9Q3FDK4_9BASI|nr:hypothetical protein [Austropuccinia psidii MF-1]